MADQVTNAFSLYATMIITIAIPIAATAVVVSIAVAVAADKKRATRGERVGGGHEPPGLLVVTSAAKRRDIPILCSGA